MPYFPKKRIQALASQDDSKQLKAPPSLPDIDWNKALQSRNWKKLGKKRTPEELKKQLREWFDIVKTWGDAINTLYKKDAIPVKDGNQKFAALPENFPIIMRIPANDLEKYMPIINYLTQRGVVTIRDLDKHYHELRTDQVIRNPAEWRKRFGPNAKTLDELYQQVFGVDRNGIRRIIYYNPRAFGLYRTAILLNRSIDDIEQQIRQLTYQKNNQDVLTLLDFGRGGQNFYALTVSKANLNRLLDNPATSEEVKKQVLKRMEQLEELLRTPLPFIIPSLPDDIIKRMAKHNILTLYDFITFDKHGRPTINKAFDFIMDGLEKYVQQPSFANWAKTLLDAYISMYNALQKRGALKITTEPRINLGTVNLRREISGQRGVFHIFVEIPPDPKKEAMLLFVPDRQRNPHARPFTANIKLLEHVINTTDIGNLQQIQRAIHQGQPVQPQQQPQQQGQGPQPRGRQGP